MFEEYCAPDTQALSQDLNGEGAQVFDGEDRKPNNYILLKNDGVTGAQVLVGDTVR